MSARRPAVPPLPVRSIDRLGPIPPVVHQIWVGKPPPPWVRHLWAEWDRFADEHGLTMRRWTNDELEGTLTRRLLRAHPFLAPVQLADLLRIEVTSLHGGLYMDSDTVPLRSLEEYVGDRPGWLGQGPTDTSKTGEDLERAARFVNNATFGFPAHHPLLGQLWETATNALARGVTRTFDIAGPTAYRRALEADPVSAASVELPRGPFVSKRRADKREERKLGRPFTTDELRERYPDALVAHLSMVSWMEGNTWNKGYRSEIWDDALPRTSEEASA